jgi:hypothetical protein
MLRGILYALNRPGYGKTTACKQPVPGYLTQKTEEWATNGRDGIVRVFDCTGRTVGAVEWSPSLQGLRFPGSARLPFGTYIIVPNGNIKTPALRTLFER